MRYNVNYLIFFISMLIIKMKFYKNILKFLLIIIPSLIYVFLENSIVEVIFLDINFFENYNFGNKVNIFIKVVMMNMIT